MLCDECQSDENKVLKYVNKMARSRVNDYKPQELKVKDVYNKISQNYLNTLFLNKVDDSYKVTKDPIILVTDNDSMYLVDGHHRLKAHTEDTIMARIMTSLDLRLTPKMKEILWKKNVQSIK